MTVWDFDGGGVMLFLDPVIILVVLHGYLAGFEEYYISIW